MDCDFNPQYIPIGKIKNNTSNIILDENDNIIYEYEYDEQNNINMIMNMKLNILD